MKKCILALLLTLAAVALPGAAQAQELCLPDCFGDLWSTPTFIDLELPGGCIVRVHYAQRVACGIWHDVQVIAVEPLNFNHTSCAAVTVMDIPDFINMVTEQLLVENPMGFPPPAPAVTPPDCKIDGVQSCRSNWRVVNGSCWQKLLHYNNPAGDVAVWAPCETTSCCLRRYRVCVDPCGNRSIENTGTEIPPNSCPVVPGYPCEPVCGG